MHLAHRYSATSTVYTHSNCPESLETWNSEWQQRRTAQRVRTAEEVSQLFLSSQMCLCGGILTARKQLEESLTSSSSSEVESFGGFFLPFTIPTSMEFAFSLFFALYFLPNFDFLPLAKVTVWKKSRKEKTRTDPLQMFKIPSRNKLSRICFYGRNLKLFKHAERRKVHVLQSELPEKAPFPLGSSPFSLKDLSITSVELSWWQSACI